MSDNAKQMNIAELLKLNAEAHQHRSEPEPVDQQPTPVVDDEVRERQQAFAAQVAQEHSNAVADQQRVEQLDQQHRPQHDAIAQQVATERQMISEALRVEQQCQHMIQDHYRRVASYFVAGGALAFVVQYCQWDDARREASSAE